MNRRINRKDVKVASSGVEVEARLNAAETNLRHLERTLIRQEKLISETKARIAAQADVIASLRKR